MTIEHITAQELLQHLVETMTEHGNTGLSFALAVSDDEGIATIVHRSDLLEQAQPSHAENMLICLMGSYYNKYMAPGMNPRTFQFGDDAEETRQ